MVKFIESEQEQLRKTVVEMFTLVYTQIERAGEALMTNDQGTASQVIVFEHKVNSFDLQINKMIEDYLALYNPVAVDLRFVLAILQISTDLERIGDYARSIARFVKDSADDAIDSKLLVDTQLERITEQVLSMLTMTQAALEGESVEIAHNVFEKDRLVNKLRAEATNVLAETLISCQDSESAKKILHLQDVIRKLERTGDHIKNIAEEIIFYIDAKVLRHKGKTIE